MLTKILLRKARMMPYSLAPLLRALSTHSRRAVFNKTFSHCNASGDSHDSVSGNVNGNGGGGRTGTYSGQGRDLSRIIVFYDGKCDLCTAEITHYRSLLHAQETSPIAFFDLTESLDATHTVLKEFNIPATDPFKRVHVVVDHHHHNDTDCDNDSDSDYEVFVSTRAFCEIWSRVPVWRHIVPFVRNVPGIIQLSDFAYGCIAETRLRLLPSAPSSKVS